MKFRIIALMIEAARTSETSVDFQLRTRQYIREDSELRVEFYLHSVAVLLGVMSTFPPGFNYP
jgi:hypothetical protein